MDSPSSEGRPQVIKVMLMVERDGRIKTLELRSGQYDVLTITYDTESVAEGPSFLLEATQDSMSLSMALSPGVTSLIASFLQRMCTERDISAPAAAFVQQGAPLGPES